MEINLYRDTPILREARTLPAAVYNLTRALLARVPRGAVFVPIRTMQYLAIIDQEEIVFVDSQYRNEVVIAWRAFQSAARTGLDEPVGYELLVYQPDGRQALGRLQAEFPRALALLAERGRPDGPARVLKFQRPARPDAGR